MSRDYEHGVIALQEGMRCRELWLAVIDQALVDAGHKSREHKRDLPQVVESQWWRQICSFAGCEAEADSLAQKILAALGDDAPREPPKKYHKRVITVTK